MIDPLINGIIPLFSIILVGYLSGRYKILGVTAAEILNRFVFYFALPLLMFRSLATTQFASIFNGPFIISFTASMLITYALAYALSSLFLSKKHLFNPMRAVSASYPNAGYIGIPFLYAVFGEKGLVPATFGTSLSIIPMIITLFLLDLQSTQKEKSHQALVRACFKTLVNPAVIAPLIGMLYAATTLPLPKIAVNFCTQLGNAAIPCALFAIGLNLKAGNFLTRPFAYTLLIILKLLIAPAIALAIALALGASKEWMMASFLLSALPSGVLTSIIAQRYGVYEVQSSTLIFLTTLLSLITLSIALIFIVPVI